MIHQLLLDCQTGHVTNCKNLFCKKNTFIQSSGRDDPRFIFRRLFIPKAIMRVFFTKQFRQPTVIMVLNSLFFYTHEARAPEP